VTFGTTARLAGLVSAPAFSPDSISGLELWLDASDAATITATGNNLTQWDDKSTAGNDCGTVRGTGNPQTGVSTQNSLNVISFSGLHDIGITTTGHGLADSHFTASMVFAATGFTTFSCAPLSTTSGSLGRPYDYWQQTTPGSAWIAATRSDSANWANVRNTSFFVMTVQVEKDGNGTNSHTITHRVNGSQVHSANITQGWFTNGNLRIGRRDDGVTTFVGNVGEIVSYDALLSTSEMQSVETYLTNKWGVV
jgi:hypothetical protein